MGLFDGVWMNYLNRQHMMSRLVSQVPSVQALLIFPWESLFTNWISNTTSYTYHVWKRGTNHNLDSCWMEKNCVMCGTGGPICLPVGLKWLKAIFSFLFIDLNALCGVYGFCCLEFAPDTSSSLSVSFWMACPPLGRIVCAVMCIWIFTDNWKLPFDATTFQLWGQEMN